MSALVCFRLLLLLMTLILRLLMLFSVTIVSIDQEAYVDQLLKKWQKYVGKRNYTDTPMKRGHIIRDEDPATSKQRSFVDSFPYIQK